MIRRIDLRLLLPVVGLALTATPALAEVYVAPSQDGHSFEAHISPAGRNGALPWTPRSLSSDINLILNPDGDLKEDGVPVIATSDTTGFPMAAWAARVGSGDRDIAVSMFDGQGWYSLPSIRPDRAHDDLQPALLVVDGLPFVAWTEKKSATSVWVSRFTGDGYWTNPIELSVPGVSLYRPTVLLVDSKIVVSSLSRAIGKKGPATILQYQFERAFSEGIARPDGTDGPTPFPPANGPGPGGSAGGGIGSD